MKLKQTLHLGNLIPQAQSWVESGDEARGITYRTVNMLTVSVKGKCTSMLDINHEISQTFHLVCVCWLVTYITKVTTCLCCYSYG